ncbi:MAG: hypothetical protein ACYS76_13645, partial [Planctomycetota bacterium]
MASVGRTFPDLINSGGHEWVAVYHIGGMDWCAVSSPKLQQAFDDYVAGGYTTAVNWYKRALFGGEANLAASYPEDDVQILPIMDADLGRQKISYDEKKGIDVGSWSVRISRAENGYVYANGTQTGWGLPGLDWIIDTGQDASVNRGVLAADFDGTALIWNNDQGLAGRINGLAAGELLLLYVGSRSVLCRGGSTTATYTAATDTWSASTVPTNGALHSPNQRIYSSIDNDQQRIEIVDIPHAESVAGLFAFLYLVPINPDGTIEGFDTAASGKASHDFPIMFRAGEVTTNPSGDASSWKITHGSITSALKAKVPTERFTGTLAGYQFCHSGLPDNLSGQLPHLGVIEVEGSAVRTERFYLATVGNYVRYETWQDLMDGVLSALDGAGTLQFAYKQGQDGDLIYYDATVSKTTVLVYGPAAVALGIGYLRDDKIDLYRTDVGSGFSRHFATAVQTVNAFFSPGNPIPVAAFGVAGIEYAGFDGGCIALRRDNGDGIWKHDVRYDSGTATVVLDQAKDRPVTKNDSVCKYVYQWDWADITFDFSGAFELYYNARGAWQVPEDGSSNRRLYLTGETDATQLDDGDPITFGDPDRFIPKEGVPVLENHGGTGSYMIMEGELDGTPADSSYIEIKGGAPGPTVDHAKGPESYPANVSAPNHRGLSLYWAPALQNEDPWQVADSRVMASDSPSLLFRELLGDTTTILDFPSRVPITTIPNVNATDDQVLIDWDAWAELDGFAPYNYDFTQKDITALGAMSSFAFTHGYRMTYGYKETERAFVLGLAPIAATSESQATFEGRSIDNQVLRPDVPTDKIGSGWLYSAVQMDVQAAPGAKREVRAAHSIGRTAHIAESKDLVVKDPISIFPDDETTGLPSIELLGRAESYARLFATPV